MTDAERQRAALERQRDRRRLIDLGYGSGEQEMTDFLGSDLDPVAFETHEMFVNKCIKRMEQYTRRKP
jgi:hypothetical protein